MARRAFHPYLCLFLLLAVQQVTLTHAVWHSQNDHCLSSNEGREF